MECPSAKRNKIKSDYKICGHCHKELNLKIYKDHKRLYYDPVNKSWVQDDNCDAQGGDQSSSDFDSIDDIDLLINCSSENASNAIQVEHQHSDDSNFRWEEPLGTPENTDKGTCSSVTSVTCIAVATVLPPYVFIVYIFL